VRLHEADPGPGRYIAAGTFLRWPEVRNIIEEINGKPPRSIRIPAPALRAIGSFLDLLRNLRPIGLPLTAESATYITRWHPVPNSKAFDTIDVTFRDVSVSIRDTVEWLRTTGHL
jgi:hypothetical protein